MHMHVHMHLKNGQNKLNPKTVLMKKSIVALFAVALMATSAQAQESYNTGKFNPLSVDVNLNLFGNNFNNLNLDRLNVRYFLNNQSAIRVQLGFGASNNKNKPETKTLIIPANATELDKNGTYTINTTNIEDTYKENFFSLSVGYEIHNNLSDKIDIYGGGLLGFSLESFSETTITENHTEAQTVNSGNYSFRTSDTRSTTKYFNSDDNGNQNTFALTAAVFGGADFYLYKNLYVGAELGLSYAYGKKANGYTENEEKRSTKTKTGTDKNTINYTSEQTTTIKGSSKTGITETNTVNTVGTQSPTTSKTYTYSTINNRTNTFNVIGLGIEPSFHIGIRF